MPEAAAGSISVICICKYGPGECPEGAVIGENSHLLTGTMHVRNVETVKEKAGRTQKVAKMF